MRTIATWIDEAILNFDNEEKLADIKNRVKELTKNFPLYPTLK
jgi:glycine/serine hydroxymethyltransferase